MIEVSERDFDEKVLRAELPVLVDFWAPWCGPCLIVGPTLESLAPDFEGRLVVAKLNVDAGQSVAARYGVTGIPTLILFKNGGETARSVGALPAERLRGWIEQNL